MLFDINWGFVFTIVNLLVLYLLLKKFLFGPIRGIMEKREQLIQNQLSSAKDKEQQALALKEQYAATLADVDSEAETILEKARNRGKEEYESILQNADTDAKRMIKEAKREIQAEREKNMRQLSSEIAGLAVAAAEKAVGAMDSGFDEEMMNAFLKEEGALHD